MTGSRARRCKQWSRNFSFISDTGADTSLLMPLDGQRMGIDYGLFENEVSTLGIGGASENFVEAAHLNMGLTNLIGHSVSCEVRCQKHRNALRSASSGRYRGTSQFGSGCLGSPRKIGAG